MMQDRVTYLLVAFVLMSAVVARGQSSLFDDPELRVPDVKPGSATRPATPSRVPEPATVSPPTTPSTRDTTPDTPPRTTVPRTTAPRPTAPRTGPGTTTPPPPLPPPDPAKMFQSLYGVEAARVESTPVTRDDLDLARKLNEAVRIAIESPGLQRLMLERAYAYASKDPAGLHDAMHSIASLRRLFPSEGDLWDDRSLELQEKVWKTAPATERLLSADVYRRLLTLAAERQTRAGKYTEAIALARRAADAAKVLDADAAAEAKDLMTAIVERQRLDRRATELLEKIARAGSAAAADTALLTEAAELIVGVLPRPSELRALPVAEDKVLTYLLAVAALPDRQINATHAAWMGDFFRKAAEQPKSPHRREMLRASAAWYAHFLAMHLPLDSDRLRVLLAAQQVHESLSQDAKPLRSFDLQGSATPLLTTLEPARHRVSGTWNVTTAGASVNASAADAMSGLTPTAGLMALPVSPGDAYEVTLQFAADGATAVGLVLPVGAGSVAISRSNGGCNLSDVRASGYSFGANMLELSRDTQRHTLYVRVVAREGKAAVLVAYDGFEVGRWEGSTADLAPPTDLSLPNRAAMGVFARGGKALIADVSVHSLRGVPRLLYIPAPNELSLDGSRPRDATVTQTGERAVTFMHNGATVASDPALPGGMQLTLAEPSEDARIVRVGFTAMMSNSANLVPLRTDYPRYKQLLAMASAAPRPYTTADVQKLGQLVRDHDMAPTSQGRQRAERAIFAAMHLLADRYQRAATAWAKSVQKGTSTDEFQMIVEFGKRGY